MRDLSMTMAAWLVVSVATTAVAQSPAAPVVRAQARVSATEVTVGQTFTVEVAAEGPAGTTWTFPQHPGSEQVDLELVPATSEKPPKPGSATYHGAVFALGDVEVPAIAVKYASPDGQSGTVSTTPVAIRIGSVIPKSETEPKPADLRPPVKLTVGVAFWVALGLALVAIAGLVAWLVHRRRKPVEVVTPVVPEVPPDVEARAALDQLASSGLIEREEYRTFYIELATTAKRYLERRLGAPVLEMTSAEVSSLLRNHPLAGPHLPVVRDLMFAADWVKFAHGSAQTEAARRHLAAVRGIVASIEETLQAQDRVAREAAA